MFRRTLGRVVEFGGVVLFVVCLIFFLKSSGFFNLEYVRVLVESLGVYAPIFFIFLFIVLALFGVSVTVLIIFTTVLFGSFKGFGVSLVGLYLSCLLAFFLSNYFSHNFLRKHYPLYHFKFRFLGKIIKKIRVTVKKKSFRTIFVTNLFLSNVMVSYALGVISEDVSKRDFFLATFLDNLVLCAIFVFLGDGFLKNPVIFLGAICCILAFYYGRKLFVKWHLKHVEEGFVE